MNFFTIVDDFSVKHKVLVVPLSQTELNELAGQCEKCMPSIATSSIIQGGHPYVVVDFGGANAWKTAIALDKKSEDGHRVGDELAVGDILNVILTSDTQAVKSSGEKVYMNVPLKAVLALSFLYTAEMAENYALFKMYNQPKGE
jgi:hypothetical protein